MPETQKPLIEYTKNMFADISNSIDPRVSSCLEALEGTAREIDLEYFVVGAIARDLVFRHVYGIITTRATLDLDLGLRVESWDQYHEFFNALCEGGLFVRVAHDSHRLLHSSGLPVDLVPFGNLESPRGTITWPPENSKAMSVVGFKEALASSIELKIGKDPVSLVRVATLPALAIMKFISWGDRPEERGKDAQDIMFIAKHYGDRDDNQELMLDSISEDEDVESFDVEVASARLLGIHIRKISEANTLKAIRDIISTQLSKGEYSRFVEASLPNYLERERGAAKNADILASILTGINAQ